MKKLKYMYGLVILLFSSALFSQGVSADAGYSEPPEFVFNHSAVLEEVVVVYTTDNRSGYWCFTTTPSTGKNVFHPRVGSMGGGPDITPDNVPGSSFFTVKGPVCSLGTFDAIRKHCLLKAVLLPDTPDYKRIAMGIWNNGDGTAVKHHTLLS